ncbi:universal stress protein [Fulvivirga imtechensis AK7]|uniref:Universal stress protein n=1 Tax=Fulvivirga imtechensis AK7 TaxID=1237149 RepID=L8JRN2_9BACT|nr:universal stress protein [Fulvivirga imtechensis]ELR70144.1 universal stress protein [Fulvivirga imtechensis AK7]
MKKILCPTDFTDTAHNAIAYAAKFAQANEAQLIIFNVQSVFDISPVEIIKGHSEAVDFVRRNLEAQALEVAKEFNISCYGEVEVSNTPLSSIISDRGKEFDLIIMGTNGTDDLYQFFMGSNTYNVIRKSSIPVLLIPADCGYSAVDLVVYAYDYVHKGVPALNQLTSLLRPFNSRVCVLQVLDGNYTQEMEVEVREQQALLRDLFEDKQDVIFDLIHSGELSESIHRYVLRNKADILALSIHHYSLMESIFHKSLTKKISSIADYPVLVFHE